MSMKAFDMTALVLVIIGAVNWGLIGFFKFDFISTICGGQASWLARIIYAIVGLCGLYAITLLGRLGSSDDVQAVRNRS